MDNIIENFISSIDSDINLKLFYAHLSKDEKYVKF